MGAKLPSETTLSATRARVLAFRLHRHHLDRRLPAGAGAAAAGACGLQDTPPGSAELALAARVEDLSPPDVRAALEADKSLLRIWSLRGAPYVVPTRDASIFTSGVLPDDEEARRSFVLGATPLLDRLGLRLDALVAWTRSALEGLLAERPVAGKQELATAVAARMAPGLPAELQRAWAEPHELGPVGFVLVSYALRLVALEGVFCMALRSGGKPVFWLTERWLGAALPPEDPAAARAELVMRYLRCYGPSTCEHFAAWAGIEPAQARRMWRLVESELIAVAVGPRQAWLLAADAEILRSAPAAVGVRLLPPHDPYLLMRDRDLLLPDRALHPRVWRATVNPGVVIGAGELRALWRARKVGRRLVGRIEPLGALTAAEREAIAHEAERLAPFKGCSTAEWAFA